MSNTLTYRWEIGTVFLDNTIDAGFITNVSFSNIYYEPVVVAYIYTRVGGQSVQVRVKNITDAGCDIFMQEPDYEGHSDEYAVYMVMEAGVWNHPVLGKMIAQNVISTTAHGTYETFNFPSAMPSAPAFFATLNTYNNNDFSSIRCRNLTSTSFEFAQTNVRTTTSETVGYIALERNISGSILGKTFEIGHGNDGTIDGVDNTPHTITFTQSYSSAPLPLVFSPTVNGGDNFWARAASAPTTTTHDVYAEEDQVDDSERAHADEDFSWFIVSAPIVDFQYHTAGNLTSNSYYTFKANVDHVLIYDVGTTSGIGQIDYSHGISAIWANDTNLYLATNLSGIAYIPITSVSAGNYTDLNDYKKVPDITSNATYYIHGADQHLCVTTLSGVDHYNIVSGTRTYTNVIFPYKCHQTTTGELYYNIDEELHAVYDSTTNWPNADFVYDSDLIPRITTINDIFITENTSIHAGENVIILATDNGAHIIEEWRGNEENSSTKRYYIV